MNKRLLFIGGGAFTVLLAIFAVLSSNYDDSAITIQRQQSQSFLTFEQVTQLSSNNPDLFEQPNEIDGSEAVNPKQVMNLTRLGNTISYMLNQVVGVNVTRTSAIITTDKVIYRGNDTIFVEVLLIDSLTNKPVQLPPQSANVNDTFIRVDIGLYNAAGDPVNVTNPVLTQNVTNATGPTVSAVFKLPQDVSFGDYAIRACGVEFAPSSRIIQVRLTQQDEQQQQQSTANFKIQTQVFGDNLTYSVNDTIFGKIVLQQLTDMPFPDSIMVLIDSGSSEQRNSDIQIYDLIDGQAYIFFTVTPQFLNSTNKIGISVAIIDLQKDYSQTGDYIVLNITRPDLNNYRPPQQQNQQQSFNPQGINPNSIKIYFQTESLSDLVFNVSQKVYFYSYLNPENDQINDNIFNFGQAQLRAYNQSQGIITTNPINITGIQISQIYSGFGFFYFNPREFLTYFLEIRVPNQIRDVERNLDIRRDNVSMKGNHILDNGVVRIPLIVEGFQTKRNRFDQLIDNQTNPNSYKPKFNEDLLIDFNFTHEDQGSGFIYQFDGTLWTVGYPNMPPLLVFTSFPNPNNFNSTLGFYYGYNQGIMSNPPQSPAFPQTFNITTITFNTTAVVAKFVSITRYYLQILDQGNATLLNFTNDNILDGPILSRLFPGNNLPSQNSFGNYGPTWLKQNVNLTQAPPAPKNVTRLKVGPEIVLKLLNRDKYPARVIENGDEISLEIATNLFIDPNDYYLITIRQKDRILYSEVSRFNKDSISRKNIKADQFKLPMGGLMTVNLYKITEDYFLFQNTTNGTLCDYSILEQLMFNGTLQVQMNGSVIFNGTAINSTFNASNASIQAQNPFNSSIPYTRLPINCVLITIEQVANFLEQKGSISFFKRPSSNLNVEIITNKNNYMQGERVNVTFNVRNSNTRNNDIINDPGYLYVSTTEDKDVNNSAQMPDLPAQLYLFQEIDERRLARMIPNQPSSQYITRGQNTSDYAFEIILAASQLRNLVFEFEYFQQISRNLSFGHGGSLTITDIINLSQMYGINFLSGEGEQKQSNIFNMMEVLRTLPPSDNIAMPYRRTFAPRDMMLNSTRFFTNQTWSHLTPPDYNRSANLDWTETLFWGSAIKTVGGKANVSFQTSDLNTVYRIQANFYSNVGVTTSYKRFTVGKAFNYKYRMPSQMAVGDSYNATLTIENFSPTNITITVFPLQFDSSSMQVRAPNGDDLSLFSFQSGANRTQTFNVVVTPLKAVKKTQLTLAVRGTANDSLSVFTEVFTQQFRVFHSGLTRQFFQAGVLSTNSASDQSSANFTASFPESLTYSSVKGSIYLTSSFFTTLLTFVNLFEEVDASTSDDIIARIDILQMVLDQMQPIIVQAGPNLKPETVGFIREIKWKQEQYLKKLMKFAIYSNSMTLQNYRGFDNFRRDNQIESKKTGSIVNTAYAAFILNQNPSIIRNFKGANDTYQAIVQYLNSIRNQRGNLTQVDTNSDYQYRIKPITLNAFITVCLNQLRLNASTNATANNTLEIRELINTLNSTINLTVNAWENITSDPYQLALAIFAVATANQSYVTPWILNFTANVTVPQLLKHLNTTTGAFENSPKTMNSTQSPINSQGNDRVIEQTSWAILALSYVNATQYGPVIRLAANFLRRQHPMTIVQNGYTLDIMLRALQITEWTQSQEYLGQGENVVVTISYNGNQLSQKTINATIAGAYKLNISSPVFTQNSTGNFTIKVTQATNDTKQIFYFADLSYVDNKFNGTAPRQNGINVSISSNYTRFAVRDKNNTQLYGYTITVNNRDKNRASSPVYVTLRIPACLDTDEQLLKLAYSQNSNIGEYKANDDDHLFTVLVRPLGTDGQVDFRVATRQVDQGLCKMRFVTIKNKGSGEEYALRFNDL